MKTILLTGSFGGIGQAIAKRFAADGYRVAALGRPSTTDRESTFLSTLAGEGHAFFPCDVTDENSVKAVVADIVRQFSTIDACVHAATGRLNRKRALDMSAEEFKNDFEVGLMGGLHVFQAVVRVMRSQKAGRIVGITTAGLESGSPMPRMGGYLMAKAAFRELLREMSQELASSGITVNAVAPGFVKTPLHDDVPDKVAEFAAEGSPIKRTATVEEVADVVASLCAEENRQTGLSLPVAYGEVTNL